jgi:hypothetical protein
MDGSYINDRAALIPCIAIERERDWRNMVDILLSLLGQVYRLGGQEGSPKDMI